MGTFILEGFFWRDDVLTLTVAVIPLWFVSVIFVISFCYYLQLTMTEAGDVAHYDQTIDMEEEERM